MNKAALLRSQAQQLWPGATVQTRGRKDILHLHPDDPDRFMLDTSIGPIHFGINEDQEIDTAWQQTGGGVDQQHGNYEIAKQRLAPYNATLIREMSLEAARDFEDSTLDFVYIDGNHTFDYVMLDLILWGRKVKPGGIIAGHDYYHFRWAGVVEAVDAYIKTHNIRQWYLTNEREPTFYWLKG